MPRKSRDPSPPAELAPEELPAVAVPEPDEAPAVGEPSALAPSDTYRHYLRQVVKHPRLTREEEHELAVRYRKFGDRDAAFRLVTGNLRLVVRIAFEYRRAFLN